MNAINQALNHNIYYLYLFLINFDFYYKSKLRILHFD